RRGAAVASRPARRPARRGAARDAPAARPDTARGGALAGGGSAHGARRVTGAPRRPLPDDPAGDVVVAPRPPARRPRVGAHSCCPGSGAGEARPRPAGSGLLLTAL